MAKNEAKIKFTAETGEFNKQIQSANNEMTELRAELRLNETQMKDTGTTVEGLENKHKILSNQLKAAENKVEALTAKHKKAVEIFGENSTEASKLKTQLLNAQNAEDKLEQEVKQCSTELEMQKKGILGASEAAEKSSTGFTVMKGALANLVSDGIQRAVSAMGDFVKSTVDTGIDFTSTMSEVQAVSGATGGDLEALKQKAIDLGGSTVFSATEVGNAMVEMAKAGWTSEQILDGMAGVLNASSASGEDLATVATIAADAISGFGMKASDSTRVADLLTQAANAGTIGVSDLGETFKYIAPVAGSMGLSIEDVTTAVTAMSMSGIKGSQAGTALRTMLTNLVKPTDAMETAMQKLGIEISNTDGTMKPLDTIIGDLRSSFDGLTDEQKTYYAATLAGKEGMSGMLSLMNLTQEEYDEIASSMNNAKGVAEETSSVMLDNLGGDLEELGGNFETLKLEIFDTFEGTMRDGVGVLNDLVDGIRTATQWLTEHKAVVATVAAVIGVLTAGITAYNVVQGVKAAMEAANVTTVWALVSAHIAQAAAALAAVAPYIAIAAAIAAVIAVIVLCVKNWDKIKAKITEVAQKVKEKVLEIKNQITEKLNAAKQKAVEIFENIKKSVSDKITSIRTKVTEIFNSIKDKIMTPINTARARVIKMIDNLRLNFSAKLTAIKTFVTSVFTTIKSKIMTPINTAKSKVVSTIESLRSSFSSKITSIKDKVTSVFSSLKDKLTKPIEQARSTIKNTVDKIKKVFNFSWSLPKLKIPKISITGGKAPYGIAGKGSLPKFSITWHKEGAIFKKPTVFDTRSGLHGVGEAGAEAILPVEKLKDYIADTVEDKMNVVNLGALAASIERLADRPIDLNVNGRKFATATAGDSDRVNGLRSSFLSRDLVLD